MKNIKIVLTFALLTSICVWSQTEKGNFLIGASSNLNFSSLDTEIVNSNSQSTKTNQFNFAVDGGYFIADHLALGLGTSYTSSKNGDFKNNTFLVAPFAKYYFLEGNTKLFARASYGLGRSTSDFIIVNSFGNPTAGELKGDINSFELGAGVAFFINEFLSIELTASYLNQKIDFNDFFSPTIVEQKSTGLNSSVGFVFFL